MLHPVFDFSGSADHSAPPARSRHVPEFEFTLRPITPNDDAAVARLIRAVLAEFEPSPPEREDPRIDAMSGKYADAEAQFLVVEVDGRVVGCGGFAPLRGAPAEDRVCELQKMLFAPELRGRGVGRQLLEELLGRMRAAGYRTCYLETRSNMTRAQTLYESFGFVELDHTIGCTGHTTCDRQFHKPL